MAAPDTRWHGREAQRTFLTGWRWALTRDESLHTGFSGITALARNGLGIRTVQQWLGFKQVIMTLISGHAFERERDG
jgi:hypothetical protein